MTYEELQAENLRLRARIRELEQENARLKGYGSSFLCEPEPPQYGNGPMRPERNRDAEIQRRLDIFKGLFRGREDVFAKRFVSKTGKAGHGKDATAWSLSILYNFGNFAGRNLITKL